MADQRPLGVVLATRSTGKIAELRELFGAAGFGVADLDAIAFRQDPPDAEVEVHATFEENALAKARWYATRLSGRAVISEDSGLEVRALGGAPGVRSKRWAGSTQEGTAREAENNAALVRALEGARASSSEDAADRAARYVCVAVCVWGDREWSARGACAGRILEAPRGAGGFGYDPWFFSEELGRTFAEASREEKSRVSHRGRAIRALIARLGS